MATALSDSCRNFSARKFYPPPPEPARHLFRKALVNTLLRQFKRSRLILIEAQAGQGKSILAAQFVSQCPSSFGWYQIGSEDGDPVRFLTNLLACLENALPAFSSPLLEDMLRKGEINAYEYPRYLDLLCADLGRSLTKDFFIVFEDLHLLEKNPAGQDFLAHFVAGAPQSLRFILTSRRPVLNGQVFETAPKLDNKALRLSELEIFVFYNEILSIPITRTDARALRQATEGWIMGLVLAGVEIRTNGRRRYPHEAVAKLEKASADGLADYFRKEVFSGADKGTRRDLCRLALLSTIPLELAKTLTGNPRIAVLLNSLVEKNYFVRRLNDAGTEFAFHHLFQESLRTIAGEELSETDRVDVFNQAGNYFFAQGCPEEALAYYARAENFRAVDKVLEKEGLALNALNRLASLETVFRHIPAAVINSYGWLAFFQGLILIETDPPASQQFLYRSLQIFTTAKNEIGAVLARAKIVYYHHYIDTKYNLGLPFLEKLEKEFTRVKNRLDSFYVINIAQILSVACSFMIGDIPLARRYGDLAFDLASELKVDNVLAEIHLARAWSCYPDLRQFSKMIEACFSLTENPSVSAMNKMQIRFCAINLLEMEGDFENYVHQELQLIASAEVNLVAKTGFGPFILIFKIDIAIAQGDYEQALELVRQGLDHPLAGANAHIQSQYFHYLAFLKALSGEREAALQAAEESLALTQEVGGKVFITLNQMIVGGVYALLGIKDKAEGLLKEAIRNSRELGEEYLRAGAHAYSAYLLLKLGNQKAAGEHIHESLRCLRENGYVHFFGCSPALMQPVLEAAVADDIETAYAQKLAGERLGIAILRDGTSIPLLNIHSLGGLSLSLGERRVQAEDLTPTMRELLALVISSPGLKINQEEILASLWADISVAKARGRFDTLLLELRKTLKAAFAGVNLTHYLVLAKGMLCLQNCRVDALRFTDLALKGLTHTGKKEFWQAGNSFNSATLLWKGHYFPGLRGKDRVSQKGYELDNLYSKISLTWGKILKEGGRLDECVEVLSQALNHNLTDDDLVRALYQAYLINNQPVLANDLLKTYETALKAAEYDPEEIKESLENVWATPVEDFTP